MFGKVLWYGRPPLPGVRYNLERRGLSLLENLDESYITDILLGMSSVVVFDHSDGNIDVELAGYKQLAAFVNHGLLLLCLVDNTKDEAPILDRHFNRFEPKFPWARVVKFLPNLSGINLDNVITREPVPRWSGRTIKQLGEFAPLTAEERLLVDRAFQKAEEIHVREIKKGFSGSRVFMAYEKRRDSSIAHWTQPRLVKIGTRDKLTEEVGNMKAVSPFVPFELRPNLEIHVQGFRKSLYVADFVDKSDSLISAARAGRGEAAISNLFNRTLQRWRDRAWQCEKSSEPLAVAAQRLNMFSPDWIDQQYLDTELIQSSNLDINRLWQILTSISFPHRAASIHGDLHGENVRVRGDDAILIDLGSVNGTDDPGQGAPLCFDVAMLEVALVFTCTDEDNKKYGFQQKDWESEVRPYYKLDSIISTYSKDVTPKPDSWMFGCLQRVRAFGIFDQSNKNEYAIALAIALLRWCKFQPSTEADRGRRVVALSIAAALIDEIDKRK